MLGIQPPSRSPTQDLLRVSPATKTDMGAVQPLDAPIMDDILSPLYNAESDLAIEMSLESDLQDFHFINNEDNTLYPMDFTLIEESQAVHDFSSQLTEDFQSFSSEQFSELDLLYENFAVNLDNMVQPTELLSTSSLPPCNQQAGDSSVGLKVKELSLELKNTAVTPSSGAPSTPDLIRTILHLESAGDQPMVVESKQLPTTAYSTINAEALCGGEQILLRQSPASSSPSSPSPSTSSSCLMGVSREPSLSRPGTSCSSIAPVSPAPSTAQRPTASKRRNANPLTSTVDTKKLKNNEASRKSRLKRKERQDNQVEQIKQLERNNRCLVQKVAELERLRDLLRSYSSQVTFVVSAVR